MSALQSVIHFTEHPFHHRRPFVYEARIHLNQIRPCDDFFNRVAPIAHSTDPNDNGFVTELSAKKTHHFGGPPAHGITTRPPAPIRSICSDDAESPDRQMVVLVATTPSTSAP